MIGGKLFGIIGIIFFLPLMAVVVELVRPPLGGTAICPWRGQSRPPAGLAVEPDGP